MTNDEAMKLAHKLKNKLPFRSDVVDLCDYILSGSMKREIENAAFERAAQVARCWIANAYDIELVSNRIRALIQPPAQQKENRCPVCGPKAEITHDCPKCSGLGWINKRGEPIEI